MTNNRLWKRTLQDLINTHNRQHARKPKGVSNKTMQERASSLFRTFGLLRRLGFEIDPANLAGRHLQVLVDYWTCHPRVADRCRQQGVAMLERAHSAAYLQQQLSFLRVYADHWIGKPGMVHPLAHYLDDPSAFKRTYAATQDRSWDGHGVAFASLVEKVAAIDARVAAQLALLHAFGLRRKEAVMFMPRLALVRREEIPALHHPAEQYLAFLRVERGTKGGRLRFVAVRNDEQRGALQRALPFAPHASSHLGHPGLTLKQALKRFDNVLRKAGITRRHLGVTAHGLRHQFAQEFHVELAHVPAPVRGGERRADPETLKAALLEIARQLGHNRPQIVSAYCGAPARAAPSAPSSDNPGVPT